MKSIYLTMVLLLLSTMSFAQASMNKVKNAPLHAGDSRTFEIEYKQAVKFAKQAIVEGGLTVESSEKIDDGTYMIMSKAKTSAWSWGEIVRVVISKEEKNECVIRVYTKKRVGINVTAKGSYSQTIFSNIESNIEFGD